MRRINLVVLHQEFSTQFFFFFVLFVFVFRIKQRTGCAFVSKLPCYIKKLSHSLVRRCHLLCCSYVCKFHASVLY